MFGEGFNPFKNLSSEEIRTLQRLTGNEAIAFGYIMALSRPNSSWRAVPMLIVGAKKLPHSRAARAILALVVAEAMLNPSDQAELFSPTKPIPSASIQTGKVMLGRDGATFQKHEIPWEDRYHYVAKLIESVEHNSFSRDFGDDALERISQNFEQFQVQLEGGVSGFLDFGLNRQLSEIFTCGKVLSRLWPPVITSDGFIKSIDL